MKHITHNKKGFTLIEILVAITIFSILITIVLGIFSSTLQIRQRYNQIKEIEDNARYTMELMSREIRMAQSIDAGEATSPPDSEIDFTNSFAEAISFCRADSTGTCDSSGDYLAKNNTVLTSNKVKITNLTFYVNNFDLVNGPHPRVTISMTMSSNDDSVSMNFQTTVSLRNYGN